MQTTTKICAHLSGITNMVMFPFTKNGGQTSSIPVSNTQLQFVNKISWVSGRMQRKLVNESVGTFLSLQKASKDATSESDFQSVIVKKSREYRSMIQACVAEQNQNSESEPTMEESFSDPKETKVLCELLYKMELILGLVEVTFLDTQISGAVLNQLLHWIRFHFPQCRQKMSECLEAEQPHLHPSYWEACYGLVLQGSIEETRELLSQHPRSNSDSFLSMDELLRKMPVYLVYSGISEGEFTIRWNHWQSECVSRLERGEFADSPGLKTICSILCGDKETMLSLTTLIETWYHMMVSQLLYTNPTVKIHRLPTAANDAILSYDSQSHLSTIDRLLLAIIEVNYHQVIKLCITVLDNLWFVVHLIDLFYHSLGKDTELKYIQDMRQSFLLDYASELTAHQSLWQVGLMYLDHSPGSSLYAQAILERIPLTDDNKATKIIQAAVSRNLPEVVKTVCCVMGRQALKREQLGSAIWWGVRSRDSAFTSHLAHKILHHYMKTGQFDSASLLDNLGPLMLLSDTLTFLSKYREFHLLYQDGNLEDAATLLVDLMSSKLAPKYFWPVLLEDALPLLQAPDPVISSEQTYSLIYCLHNLSSDKSSKNNDDSDLPYYSSFYAKEADLRLALTNNLARAIIREGTDLSV